MRGIILLMKTSCFTLILTFFAFAAVLAPTSAFAEANNIGPQRYVARIIINLAEQRLYAFDGGGGVIVDYPISSGKGGNSTPKGEFSIKNKSVQAYSKKYSATMTHWMAITADGAYGMHGLLGQSYYKLLGSPASHGCIRLAREDAKELFSMATVGTPVSIVHDPELTFLMNPVQANERAERIVQIAGVVKRLFGDRSH